LSKQEEKTEEGYQVLLTGFDPLAGDDRTPAERLGEVLSVDQDIAEQLVANTPALLKKRASRSHADYYKKSLEAIGAIVKIKDADGEDAEANVSLRELTGSRTNDPFADMPDFPGANFRDFDDAHTGESGIQLDDHRASSDVHDDPLAIKGDAMAIEPIAVGSDHPPPLEQTDPEPAPPKTPPGPHEIDCPKCGRRQPKSTTCFRCGIMFTKYDPAQPRRASSVVRASSVAGARAPSVAAAPPAIARPGVEPEPASRGTLWPTAAEGPSRFFRLAVPAFATPFMGVGVVWLVGLIAVAAGMILLRGFAGSIAGVFVFLALLANYFAKSMATGLEGELRAPALPEMSDMGRDFVMPGAAVFGVALVLFALPTYVFYTAQITDVSAAVSDSAVAVTPLGDLASRVEAWNADEVFKTIDGKFVAPKPDDPVQRLVRANGDLVEVDPSRGTVTRLGKPKGRGGALATLLFFGLALFPLFYWPMALTVAALRGNAFSAFNPVLVIKSALRGGVRYLFVAGVGLLVLGVGYQLSVLLFLGGTIDSPFGAVMGFVFTTLAFLGYAAGVQGHLMGRLLAEQGDLRRDLIG